MADLVADLPGNEASAPGRRWQSRCTQCCRYPQSQRAQDPPPVGQVQLSGGRGGSVVELWKFGLNASRQSRRDVELEPCTWARMLNRDAVLRIVV